MKCLDSLYGTALRLTRNVAEAEDLVQDTFVRAMRFRRRFEPGTNLKAWLFKMMMNLFINKYRREKRSREFQQGLERQDMVEKLFQPDRLASAQVPEEYFFEKLFSDDVVRALEELPHDFKMVVLLVDLNEFSYAQVAEILGIPVGTVMSRLHRGRRMLRNALHDFAVEEGYIRGPAGGAEAPRQEAATSEGEGNRESNGPTDLDEFRERKLGHRR